MFLFHHNDTYHCDYPPILYTSSDEKILLHAETCTPFVLTLDIPPFEYHKSLYHSMKTSLSCYNLDILPKTHQIQIAYSFLIDIHARLFFLQ